MTPGARITAAIDVLSEVITRHRPISESLTDWGKSHRFAGSGDRNAIGGLVYDAMRRRSSIAWRFESEEPRALALGAAPDALGLAPDAVADLCAGSSHAPEPLTDTERQGLVRPLDAAPAHVRADVPLWLWDRFAASFGDHAVAEGEHLARRAPSDLRVNTLKADRAKVLKALAPFAPLPTPHSAVGIRIPPPIATARTPNLQAEAAFHAGWFEIQDEGSQLVSAIARAKPREQVLDLCAGGGGKTLAIAADLNNTGQLYAYDSDRLRLQPIHDRLRRAGVRGVQVLRARDREGLEKLGPRFDLVLVDAPCSGTGVWRRRPDAKWRLRPESLERRQEEQGEVLQLASRMVRPGGRIVYVTCSLISDENEVQVTRFLAANANFSSVAPDLSDLPTLRQAATPGPSPVARHGLILSPREHGTDGFYVACLARSV
jgi:16S rRNA (cytosine967-C5)-methyltransferase